jgi:hypothetical protein
MRTFSEELYDGLAHREHQLMYPQLTADYEEKMKLRMRTDPVMRARVEQLHAGIMDLLRRHEFMVDGHS